MVILFARTQTISMLSLFAGVSIGAFQKIRMENCGFLVFGKDFIRMILIMKSFINTGLRKIIRSPSLQ